MKNILPKFIFPVTVSVSILSMHSTACSFANNEGKAIPADIVQKIESGRAINHLQTLASDGMKGRNTPSKELDSAAEYIAGKFQQWGLEPVNGTYFHHYNLKRVNLNPESGMSLTVNGKEHQLPLKKEFIPFENTGEANFSGAPLVFAGYGISAPEFDYDDYSKLDVKGSVVVVFSGEPQMEMPTSKFAGVTLTKYSQLQHKLKNAESRGAIGLIVLNAPKTVRRLRPVGFAWPSLFQGMNANSLPLRAVLSTDNTLPTIHAGEQTATLLFGSVDSLLTLQKNIDSLYTPNSFALKATATINIQLQKELLPVRNVMGMVRGAVNPNEIVVIGAHYDHVGFFSPQQPDVDSIYNGADDNGSGTTGMLLIAEAFATSQPKPDRSILFVAFSAEEKGLLGSKAFVDNPPVGLSSVVAMLNLDMIGRNSPDTLSIGGDTRCKELAQLNAKENAELQKPFTLLYDIEQYFFRSDQASFALKKIPVLFYFSGEHDDYHRVGDHIDKINFPKLVNISRLCARTAWRVASLPGRLPYTPQPEDER